MNAEASTKRPGGRSTRVRTAVHSAAVALVAERGADQVTLPAVAQRAGVNSSSLYRRWGTVAALLADVAKHRGDAGAPPLVGDLRTDLENQAAWTLAELSCPVASRSSAPRSRLTSTSGTTDCVSVCAGSASASDLSSTRRGSAATRPRPWSGFWIGSLPRFTSGWSSRSPVRMRRTSATLSRSCSGSFNLSCEPRSAPRSSGTRPEPHTPRARRKRLRNTCRTARRPHAVSEPLVTCLSRAEPAVHTTETGSANRPDEVKTQALKVIP